MYICKNIKIKTSLTKTCTVHEAQTSGKAVFKKWGFKLFFLKKKQ